jgi:uncharacterized protein YraI
MDQQAATLTRPEEITMNFARKLSIAAFVTVGALMVSSVAALAAPAVATSDTTLRDEASYSADPIETVYAGDDIDVQDCNYSWCYVDHDGTEGWMRKSKLAFLGQTHHHHQPAEPSVGFGVNLPDGGGISLSLGGSSY